MTAAIVALAVLGLAAATFVVLPLLTLRAPRPEPGSETFDRARELQSRHQQLLASLRDLEDDRTTDKIDEADYEEMRDRLSAEAIEVMRAMDALQSERDAAAEAAREASRPLQHPGAARPGSRP